MVTTTLACLVLSSLLAPDKEAVLKAAAKTSKDLAQQHPDLAVRLRDLSGAYASGQAKTFDGVLSADFSYERELRTGVVRLNRQQFLNEYYQPLTPPERAKPPVRSYALQKVFVSANKLGAAIIVIQGGFNWLKEEGAESTIGVRKQNWKRASARDKWMLQSDFGHKLGMENQGFEDDWDFCYTAGNKMYGFTFIQAGP
ncbi:MAG TPA: hypothetical protein PLO61_06830 [Fimbriimonadaceae bacterium]|nr:hypothetical protein [Fimbriimonadaceae bacterium]HRJ33193.1 hypothetical protein [Fimbriimonadaceae bacterium]